MSDGRIRSSHERFAAPSSPDDSRMRERAETLWRYFGIIVIWPDQRLPWDVREMVKNAARRLYGDQIDRGNG